MWVWQVALVLAIAFGCSYFLGQSVVIKETSMEPTVSSGDTVLINTASYFLGSPKRGDIIVFSTGDIGTDYQIKRVVGLPNETVQISNGQIIIDGETYVEKKGFAAIADAGLASDQVELSGDEYFVLGDNRNNSEDSRHADVGAVKRENIVGKLWLRIEPKERFGMVE